MPQMNITRANNALKDFYLKGIQYQMNEKTSPFMAMIEKTTMGVTGGDITMALKYGKHGGIGNRADDGLLPIPNTRALAQARWRTKNVFGRIMISDKTIRASANDKGAFANLFEAELEDCMTDVKDNFNRQIFGGTLGIMGLAVDGRGVAPAVGNTQIEVTDARFFFEGQRVDFMEDTTDVVRDNGAGVTTGCVITAVNRTNNVLTFSADLAAGVVGGDAIVMNASYGLELTGLQDIMTPANIIYGINRATNPWFNPNVIDHEDGGNPGDITEAVLQQAIDESDIRASGNIDYISTSHGVRRAFYELLASQKRHVNTVELKGGFKALDYNGIPFVADKYAPANTIDLLAKENFKLYHMSDWDWLDRDGSVLARVTDRPVYEATLVKYADLGCDKPAAQVRIINVAEE